MKKQLMTFLLCGSLFATAQQPVDYVNPFIGTSNYGTTNPGAVCRSEEHTSELQSR